MYKILWTDMLLNKSALKELSSSTVPDIFQIWIVAILKKVE